MAGTGHADDGMRGGESDEEHRRDTKNHQQQIAQAQVAAVLALRTYEVAHRGKLDVRARAPAHEVDEQRHGGRGAGEQPEWREKSHYGASWRAENARLSGTPNGASVITGSYDAPYDVSDRRHSASASRTVA